MTSSRSTRRAARADAPELFPSEERRPSARAPAGNVLLPNGARLNLAAFRALFESRPPAAKDKIEIAEGWVAGRAGPIRVRRYLPPSRKAPKRAPAVVYLHGGGWVAGSVDSHDPLCRYLAKASGLQLLSIGYRLAPEHLFPAAVEDAIDAFTMIQHRATDWQIDPSRMILMGEGSGATLAAVTAIHARDMCLELPLAQVLLYPLLDLGGAATSDMAGWFRAHYLRDQSALDWRASPLRAPCLSGVPAAFVAAAGEDRIGRDCLAFADRLRGEGVVTMLHRTSEPLTNNPALEQDIPAAVSVALQFIESLVAER